MTKALLTALLSAFGLTIPAGPAPPSLKIAVAGQEEMAIPNSAYRCPADLPEDNFDHPDMPVRAFRDLSGQTHVLAGNALNFGFVGASLDRLKENCRSVLPSLMNGDPSLYSDFDWLQSAYTLDGRTIHALVHDEYQGWIHDKERCPKTVDQDKPCWFWSVTSAVSTDGGYSFTRGPLVATGQFRYAPRTLRGAAGIGNPTNIIRSPSDGMFYAMVGAQPVPPQSYGRCLLQSDDLVTWRYWDGAGFTHSFADPYRAANPSPPCKPVTKLSVGGIAVVTGRNAFVAAVVMRDGGLGYITSPDLLEWSEPVTLVAKEKGRDVFYPSLIDPSSPSRNFDTLSSKPYLYFREATGRRRGFSVARLPLQVSE